MVRGVARPVQVKGTQMTESVAVEACEASTQGYIHRKSEYLGRLARIEGQARGLQRMVSEERYCIDILVQVAAITNALKAVSVGLLEEHLGHCVVEAARSGDDEASLRVKEASDAIARLLRS